MPGLVERPSWENECGSATPECGSSRPSPCSSRHCYYLVVINITLIIVIVIILVLSSFPLKRGRCLNGFRQEISRELVGHNKAMKLPRLEVSLGCGTQGRHLEDARRRRARSLAGFCRTGEEENSVLDLEQNTREMFKDSGGEKIGQSSFWQLFFLLSYQRDPIVWQ